MNKESWALQFHAVTTPSFRITFFGIFRTTGLSRTDRELGSVGQNYFTVFCSCSSSKEEEIYYCTSERKDGGWV
jgi:hypothetical protein